MQAASPPQQQLVGRRSRVGPPRTERLVPSPGKLTSLNAYDGACAELSGYSGHFLRALQRRRRDHFFKRAVFDVVNVTGND